MLFWVSFCYKMWVDCREINFSVQQPHGSFHLVYMYVFIIRNMGEKCNFSSHFLLLIDFSIIKVRNIHFSLTELHAAFPIRGRDLVSVNVALSVNSASENATLQYCPSLWHCIYISGGFSSLVTNICLCWKSLRLLCSPKVISVISLCN